jgi:hypothetical protein
MGRGLSALQNMILDEARCAEAGFVLYNDLLARLLAYPVQAAIAALGDNREGVPILMLMLEATKVVGFNWELAKEVAKNPSTQAEKITHRNLHEALLAFEHNSKKQSCLEASLSRAIRRLEQRGMVTLLDVGHKDNHGRWIGHRRRGIRLTVK